PVANAWGRLTLRWKGETRRSSSYPEPDISWASMSTVRGPEKLLRFPTRFPYGSYTTNRMARFREPMVGVSWTRWERFPTDRCHLDLNSDFRWAAHSHRGSWKASSISCISKRQTRTRSPCSFK